jgi:hypothetical protein
MLIDAVIAEQVVHELLNPRGFGLAGVNLCQALAQEASSPCRIPGPSGFSQRFSGLVELDPQVGTAGLGVDRSLASGTSVLLLHGMSPHQDWWNRLGSVWNAEFGHTTGTLHDRTRINRWLERDAADLKSAAESRLADALQRSKRYGSLCGAELAHWKRLRSVV